MLSNCRAFAIAHTSTQNRGLIHLAETVGFGFVGSILGDRRVSIEAGRREIVFFLLHYGLGDSALQGIVRHLRGTPIDSIRFAPLMLIANDAPFEDILKYVRFGFDDVVTLPEKRDVLIARFNAQINTVQAYFETDTYFGPDRRRMELDVHDNRRTGTAPFTKLTFQRTIDKGIVIARRELRHGGERGTPNVQPRVAVG